MKKIFFLFFCFLSTIQLSAETPVPTDANIFGHVINSDNEHIPYINISIKNTTVGTVTDATGHYSFKNLKEGTYTLVVSGVGYKSEEKTVTVIKNKTQEVNFSIKEDVLNLNEVVVTSNRSSQSRTEAPVIVSTISTKQLETTQSNVLGEGLNYCTGLRFENDCQNCGFSQIRMNGMEGPYSQILINSRPIFSGLAGVYGLELIPSNMIEKLEIVRGGGSALYGSNAIAGTVNLILKDPKSNSFEAGYNVSLIGTGVSGSNGPVADHNINFNTSLVNDDHTAGIAIYGNSRTRKMFDANGDDYSEIAPMKNTVIGTRLFYRPAYKSKLSVDFFNIREERNGGDKQDYPLHERDIAEAVKHDMKNLALNFDQYFRKSDLLSIYASGQYLVRDSYYGANQSLNDYGNTKDKTYALGAQYKLDLTSSSLMVGIENRGDYLIDKKLGYPTYTIVDNPKAEQQGEEDKIIEVGHVNNRIITDQSLQTIGGFAQYEIKFGKLKVLAGARLERYSISDVQDSKLDKSGNVFIPRANLMYDITPYLQVRGGYSRGYRAPQVFDEDLHVNTSGAIQVIHKNDPDLKQENSNSMTLSLDFNKNIGGVYTSLLVEAFYTKLENPFQNIVGDMDDNGVVTYTRTNAKKGAKVTGVNIEFKLFPTKKLSFNSGFTIQSSKYDEIQADNFNKKDFYRTPDSYGFFTVDWKILPCIGMSATGNYTGKMYIPYHQGYDDNTEALHRSNAFFDAGLKFYYDMKLCAGVNMQWFAGMKNLFNSFQDDFDKGIGRDPAYVYGPTMPRTFYVGFKIGSL
jgi:outer membrane receptor for ferrienterochelin and colicins